jgi:drug/metabolite transporter (DMT)-like permease
MSGLWAVFTLIAAAGQTARNAMQRELTGSLGALGSTHVRFLFGAPFALAFLVAAMLVTGDALPRPTGAFWLWILLGALTQILSTALMLMTMLERSFVVTIAYLKTEPIQVAILGLVFLGETLTLPAVVAIVAATFGVMLISFKPAGVKGGARPALLGLAAAAGFALSSVGYRGAITSLSVHHYIMAASFSLAAGLVLQSVLLGAWLALRDRVVLRAILRLWRPSLFAGFLGAAASEFWFLAFALATAASVRTLALVEVLFAQATTHFVFKQKTNTRELVGIVLVVAGCALLVWVEH